MNSKYLNDPKEVWEAYLYEKANPRVGLRSGISDLDEIFRIERGSFTVMVGKPGNGKTTFLTFWAYMLARNANVKSLFFSFETPIGYHVKQFVNFYGEDPGAILSNHFFRSEKYTNSLDVIEQTIKANVEANGVKLVIIDPFNYISDTQELTDKELSLRDIKGWATKYNIAIILCHHPTKNAYKVSVENAYGSYMFNACCDNAVTIEADADNETLTVNTEKIRFNGETGKAHQSCTLYFNKDIKAFTSQINDDTLPPELVERLNPTKTEAAADDERRAA